MRGGDGRGGGGDGPGHRLPAWYLNAREEVGDEEKEALAETFADFLRRPRTASGKGYRKGGGKQQHRPHSASCTRDHRNLQLRRDDDGDISPCGMEGGEEGLDWLMYSEQEVRVELLGVGAGAGCDTVAGGDAVAPKSSPSSPPVPMQKMQPLKMPTDTQRIHEQQGGREQTQQKEPIRGLAEQRPPYRSARHQFLASLMSGGTDEGANLCRDLLLLPGPQGAERGEGESPSPACRVRCSLLCELPSQRVRLPSHAHEQQVCPSVSSPTPPKKQKQSQLQSSCGVFSVTLYDLGLVCPAALLQRPSLPCSALVAVSAGVLVECRSAPPSGSMPVPISSSSSASCTPTPESPLSHSLYLSMRELQRLCDLCPRETAATRSLSRKLLRLPCLLIEGSAGNSASASGGGGRRCERALFETLGGPRGLGAEGIEQLCNFLAEGLQISVHQPQQVQMRIL